MAKHERRALPVGVSHVHQDAGTGGVALFRGMPCDGKRARHRGGTHFANAIRGVPGGGRPWVVDFGRGKLEPDGEIDILVKGLVFDPNDQSNIDAGLAGRNTVPNFKAIVSCLSKDGDTATTVNVETGLFPADEAGNAHIKDMVDLPQPCIAPIIFVASPGGAWFASTGF